MTLPRHLARFALLAGLGLSTGGCFERALEALIESQRSDGPQTQPRVAKPKPPSIAATLPETARTDACRANLSASLAVLAKEQGLAFEVDDTHTQALLVDATVRIPYARDGIRYIPSFRLEKVADACRLTLFRQETQRPGQMDSQAGHYGSAPLADCACVLPPPAR